jgi:hypothetical protein
LAAVDKKLLIKLLKEHTTSTETPALAFFKITDFKCYYIPKPPYLSEIMTYDDYNKAPLLKNSAQIFFPVPFFLFASIFNSNRHDDIMMTQPQHALS